MDSEPVELKLAKCLRWQKFDFDKNKISIESDKKKMAESRVSALRGMTFEVLHLVILFLDKN